MLGKETGGGRECVTGGHRYSGCRRVVRFPCKLTLWPDQLTDRFIHTSRSHITTTHVHTSVTGLEVETGKQAEGRTLYYSASHSKSEPCSQPIRYPTAATETQRGKKKKI